jgi:hypothetical protein
MGMTSARKSRIIASFAVAMAISTSSAAFAQCTSTAKGTGTPIFGPQFTAIAATGGAASGLFASALGNIRTAFLTQQGSAFVSSPGDPKLDQPGWRRVGSRRRRRSDQQVLLGRDRQSERRHLQPNPGHRGDLQLRRLGAADRWRTQVGQDISRLNWGGWNVHVGTTAGYLASRSTDNSGGSTNFEVPFFGGYAVATHGRFFAEVMVREEFYNANLTNFSVGLFNQQVGGRGASVSTSAGYNFALANTGSSNPPQGSSGPGRMSTHSA